MQSQLAFEYPRTYRASVDWYIFSVLVGGLCGGAGAAGALFFASGRDPKTQGTAAILLTVLCLMFFALGSYLIFSVFRFRIVLTRDTIEVHPTSSSTGYRRDEFAGWRQIKGSKGPNTLVLVRRDPLQKPVKIIQYFNLDAGFLLWLSPLINLDEADRAAAEKEIAENLDLGLTTEERMSKLAGAKRLATILNVATGAVCVWVFLLPRPYVLAVSTLALLPWIAILVTARSHGLFRIDQQKNDPHPTVVFPFIMPGFILMLRVIYDLHFLRWQPILWSALAIGVTLWFAAYRSDASLRAKRSTAIILLLLLPAYGAGVFGLSNAVLDKSSPTTYQARVLDKYITSGRSKGYNLRLGPWGPQPQITSVDVSRTFYNATGVGATVCIPLRDGAFHVPWYVVRHCPSSLP